MLDLDYLTWGVGLPLGVSLLLVALLGGWRAGVAVAIAAAYMAGHIALDGLPGHAVEGEGLIAQLRSLQFHDLANPLFVALAAMLVGALVSCSCVSIGAVGLGRILLAFATVNAVLWSKAQGDWEKLQALVWVQAIVAIVLVIWWSLDGLADRVRGAAVPFVLTLTTGAAAALIYVTGSQPLAKLTIVLTVALLAAFIVGLFRRSMDISRGGIAVIVTVTTALLLSAVFYGQTPMWAALTVALAPAVFGWVLLSRPVLAMRPAGAAVATAVVVLIPLAVAVLPSLIKYLRP